MQQSTAIVEDSRVLDRAVAVVRGLGTMSSPELIEMLYSISSDIAESFERLAEDVPLLFLRTVVLGTTAPAVGIMVRNVLLSPTSFRSVSSCLERIPPAEVDEGALRSIESVVDSIVPLMDLLLEVEAGHRISLRNGALICNGVAVSMIGLSELSSWVRNKLSEESEQREEEVVG